MMREKEKSFRAKRRQIEERRWGIEERREEREMWVEREMNGGLQRIEEEEEGRKEGEKKNGRKLERE